jgi:DNA-binding XRE family transcriptional regulator
MKKETNIDQSFVKHLREVLGAKIKEARKSQGLDQKQLAEQVGLTASTIGKIEAGKFSSEIDIYIKIGIVLNFKLELK